jgi:hypothetical protein
LLERVITLIRINPGKLKRKACVLTIGEVIVELDVNNDNKRSGEEEESIPRQQAETALVQTVVKGLSFSVEKFTLKLRSKKSTVEITVENLRGMSTDQIWKSLKDLKGMLATSPHPSIEGSSVRMLFKQIDIETISVVVHPRGGYEKEAQPPVNGSKDSTETTDINGSKGIVFIKHLPLVIRTAVVEHTVPQGLTRDERARTGDPRNGVPLVWEPHKKVRRAGAEKL